MDGAFAAGWVFSALEIGMLPVPLKVTVGPGVGRGTGCIPQEEGKHRSENTAPPTPENTAKSTFMVLEFYYHEKTP